MSLLRRAYLAVDKRGAQITTYFLLGGTIGGLLFARFYYGWTYKKYKLNTECRYAEELIQQQLEMEQATAEASRT